MGRREKGRREREGRGGEGVGEFCMLLLSSGLASLYLNGRYIDVHVYVCVVWRYQAHQECTQHTDVVIMDDIVGVCVCVCKCVAHVCLHDNMQWCLHEHMCMETLHCL